MKKLIAFLKEEDGAALIEYVLLAALIAVAALVGMKLVGTQSQATLNNVGTEMTPAAGG
jgi:Flp pilus assembly pilin Flp